ncbi:hypothetical protein, partial [Arthrobacter sp. H5]|uniref:hypothetical protein n=1 Tax=Arthrobacter sp. H5 TaxID=1267973 RepID=UPI0005668BEA
MTANTSAPVSPSTLITGERYWDELPAGRNILPGRAHLATNAPALNLDGTWDFRYGLRPDGSDLGEPGRIDAPGMWQLQGY